MKLIELLPLSGQEIERAKKLIEWATTQTFSDERLVELLKKARKFVDNISRAAAHEVGKDG